MNTTYFLNRCIEEIFDNSKEYWIGISSTAPNIDGTGVTEPSTIGTGHSRVLITNLGSASDVGYVYTITYYAADVVVINSPDFETVHGAWVVTSPIDVDAYAFSLQPSKKGQTSPRLLHEWRSPGVSRLYRSFYNSIVALDRSQLG